MNLLISFFFLFIILNNKKNACTCERKGKMHDIDNSNWRDFLDVSESLWLFNRDGDKFGPKKDFRGAFISQIPENLMRRYTRKGDWVIDLFGGTRTTERVAAKMGRNSALLDLNFPKSRKVHSKNTIHFSIRQSIIDREFPKLPTSQLTILHPPYFGIYKFSDNPRDLSNMSYDKFMQAMRIAFVRAISMTEDLGHIAFVFGDTMQYGSLIPVSRVAMLMDTLPGVELRAKFIKNIKGNESAKGKNGNLYRYRCLINGTAYFAHEEIWVWRKLKSYIDHDNFEKYLGVPDYLLQVNAPEKYNIES